MPWRSAANGHQAPGAVLPTRAHASPATGTAPAQEKRYRRGLGVLPLDHRRPHPAGLHRDPPRRDRPRPSPRSSPARWRSTRPSGSPPDACKPTTRGAYVKNSSLRELLTEHEIQHRRIPPRTPKRNGKVERYQQTLAREWAYGQRYRNSNSRAAALPIWLNHYNYNRNHSSLQPATHQPTFGTTRGTTPRPGRRRAHHDLADVPVPRLSERVGDRLGDGVGVIAIPAIRSRNSGHLPTSDGGYFLLGRKPVGCQV